MIPKSPSSFRRGLTPAGYLAAALGSVLLLCGAGSVPVENFLPQGPMQADLNAGGHSVTNAASVGATNFFAASGFTSTASPPAIGQIGFMLNAQNLVVGSAKDGKSFNAQEVGFVPPDGGNSRDISLLHDRAGNLVRMSGLYWMTFTSSKFGLCDYFTVASSPDLKTWTAAAQVPVTGTGISYTATTGTAASGSTTLTVASAAGLSVGMNVCVPGAPNCFSTTNLGTGSGTIAAISGTTVTLASATTAAISGPVWFSNVNNVWCGTFVEDDAGTPTLTLRVSTQAGSALGTPGVGYVTCTNPGTFTAWSSYTALSGPVAGSNVGPCGSLKIGSTWYLVLDENNTATGHEDLAYYTAGTLTGTYTRGGFLGIGAAYGGSIESANVVPMGGSWYRVYFNAQAGGGMFYADATTGLTGSYAAAATPSYPGTNGCGAGGCYALRNSDDVAAFLMVSPPWQPHLSLTIPDVYHGTLGSDLTYFTVGGANSYLQFIANYGGQINVTGATTFNQGVTVNGNLTLATGTYNNFSGQTQLYRNGNAAVGLMAYDTNGFTTGAVAGTDYVTPTGSGAGLTSLNAGNLGSGTVPTARLGSGTANSGSFLRGDQTWAAVNTVPTQVNDTNGNTALATSAVTAGTGGAAYLKTTPGSGGGNVNLYVGGNNSNSNLILSGGVGGGGSGIVIAPNGFSCTGTGYIQGGYLAISGGAILNNCPQTTVSGSTSGSAVFSQPEQGSSYKLAVIYCNALTGTASYTFPQAFTHTPVVQTTSGPAAAAVTTLTTTGCTITGSATTGPIFIAGF